ncbi:MAG: sigma-E factor negative regulatory protein [Methylococcaceae bacterium]|nr:sigma-E factor negative regulatory protein [Methylococcaceae bacterium]
MPEDLNQKISQFLDNELDHVHALNLLKKMQLQSELQDKLHRYEAISHALKTDVFLLTKSDFSTKIRQLIQKEPVYLLPQHKPFKRSHKQIAVAASIVIVAVIAGRSMNDSAQHSRAVSTVQVTQHQLPEQSSNTVVYANQAAQDPLNKRINDYLQAHNSSVYTNGEADFQPFARVTAYSHK